MTSRLQTALVLGLAAFSNLALSPTAVAGNGQKPQIRFVVYVSAFTDPKSGATYSYGNYQEVKTLSVTKPEELAIIRKCSGSGALTAGFDKFEGTQIKDYLRKITAPGYRENMGTSGKPGIFGDWTKAGCPKSNGFIGPIHRVAVHAVFPESPNPEQNRPRICDFVRSLPTAAFTPTLNDCYAAIDKADNDYR